MEFKTKNYLDYSCEFKPNQDFVFTVPVSFRDFCVSFEKFGCYPRKMDIFCRRTDGQVTNSKNEVMLDFQNDWNLFYSNQNSLQIVFTFEEKTRLPPEKNVFSFRIAT